METSLIKDEYPQEDFILYNNVLPHKNNMLIEKDLNNSGVVSEENEENLQNGRWNNDEHIRFIKGCLLYKNNWKKVKKYVKTRSSAQIRSHAQKYLIKLKKKYQNDFFSKDYLKFYKNDNNLYDIEFLNSINKLNFNNIDIMEKVERNILNIFRNNSSNSNLNYSMNIDELNYKNSNESIEKKETDSTYNSKEKIFKLTKVPRKKKREFDSNEYYLNKKRNINNNLIIDFSNLYSNSIPNNYGIDPVKMAEIEKFVHNCLDSTNPEDLRKLLIFFQENPILNQNLNFLTTNIMLIPNNKEIGNNINDNFNDINNNLRETTKNNFNFFQNNGIFNFPINENILYSNFSYLLTPSQFQHSFNN
jgi:SHAQKYF class myb-like DNA-binding protein